MLVLDILVGVLILGLFYLMLPKYRKIGGLFEKKIEEIKEQNTEIVPDEPVYTKPIDDKNIEEHQEEK